jgi:hypothetical protein
MFSRSVEGSRGYATGTPSLASARNLSQALRIVTVMRSRHYDESIYGHLYERYEPAWKKVALLDDVEYAPCFYCGDPWMEKDHVMPISKVGNYDTTKVRELLVIVPACVECNRIASDVVDETLVDRKDRVQSILLRRYRRLLEIPEWSLSEIDTLEGRLRDEIASRQRRRAWLLERVEY